MGDHISLKSQWVPVCPVDELGVGDQTTIELASGEQCLVINSDGELFAVSALCTHRALSLAGGIVQRGVIVCPWHRARFNLATGQGSRPASGPIKTYEVAEIDDYICVRERENES
ncbi:hypothetical protein GCM10025762_37430 [Haloechinothrix salitolerans]